MVFFQLMKCRGFLSLVLTRTRARGPAPLQNGAGDVLSGDGWDVDPGLRRDEAVFMVFCSDKTPASAGDVFSWDFGR
jgi:hypothetical protein